MVFIVRGWSRGEEGKKRQENAIGTRSGLGRGRAGRRVRVSGLAGAVRAESWAVRGGVWMGFDGSVVVYFRVKRSRFLRCTV